MSFTQLEIAVLDVLHRLTVKVYKKRLIGLHETTNNGVTLEAALKFVFQKRGIEVLPAVALDHMLKLQHIVFVVDANYPNGRYGLNNLCTCGRHCKYTARVPEAIQALGKSRDGLMSKYTREIFSGKELNWSEVYVGQPTPVDNKRRAKAKVSKLVKAETGRRRARVWNELAGNILQHEQNKRQRLIRVLTKATFELMEME